MNPSRWIDMTKMNYEKQRAIEIGRHGTPLNRKKEFGKKRKPGKRTNLKVPYAEKDDAKCLGARWDAVNKTWYCFGSTKKFKQWVY